jgi:hypothetical protein
MVAPHRSIAGAEGQVCPPAYPLKHRPVNAKASQPSQNSITLSELDAIPDKRKSSNSAGLFNCEILSLQKERPMQKWESLVIVCAGGNPRYNPQADRVNGQEPEEETYLDDYLQQLG